MLSGKVHNHSFKPFALNPSLLARSVRKMQRPERAESRLKEPCAGELPRQELRRARDAGDRRRARPHVPVAEGISCTRLRGTHRFGPFSRWPCMRFGGTHTETAPCGLLARRLPRSRNSRRLQRCAHPPICCTARPERPEISAPPRISCSKFEGAHTAPARLVR